MFAGHQAQTRHQFEYAYKTPQVTDFGHDRRGRPSADTVTVANCDRETTELTDNERGRD